jgi:hypothetical protein
METYSTPKGITRAWFSKTMRSGFDSLIFETKTRKCGCGLRGNSSYQVAPDPIARPGDLPPVDETNKNENETNAGTIITFERDADSFVMYRIGFLIGQEENAVSALLNSLSMSQEIGIIDPIDGDCSLEVRRTVDGFKVKRGCHGCYGTWHNTTYEEAFNWLLPGACYAAKNLRQGYGGVLTEYR